jgi:hypothetical protein
VRHRYFLPQESPGHTVPGRAHRGRPDRPRGRDADLDGVHVIEVLKEEFERGTGDGRCRRCAAGEQYVLAPGELGERAKP